jgi:predicted hotdog family 3-hydroxylacyl-ACP dehydratase
MLDREAIAALIPHQGDMCLLDRVVDWNADHIILTTTTHRSPTNPLRLNNRLHAIHLCEYGAQAMAVHGGLAAQAAGRKAQPGFLVSLRDVALNIDFIDALAGELCITATRLLETPTSWQYSFTIHHATHTLATGRAAVVARSNQPQQRRMYD